MYLASAYPNSALSALTMMVIGFVMAGCLAAWLGLVFLADREPRGRRGRQGRAGQPGAPAESGPADNELTRPGEPEVESRPAAGHGVAA